MSITIEKVRVSQLGNFIDKASKEYNLNKLKDYNELAKIISKEYSVKCTVDDITQFYQLDNLQLPSGYESRAIEYGIKIDY